jgi:hypothetical protein
VVPGNVRDETAREGACAVLEGRRLVCDPPCGAGQTCDVGGACIAYPRARSVGAVTVRGLKDALTLEPSRGYYSSAAVTLTHPAFDEGATLTLEAAGAELPGFTLGVRGVAPLEVPDGAVQLERGAPLSLRWTQAQSASARVRVVVDLAVDSTSLPMLEKPGNRFITDCLKRKVKWLFRSLEPILIKFMPSSKVILTKTLVAYSYQIMLVKAGL